MMAQEDFVVVHDRLHAAQQYDWLMATLCGGCLTENNLQSGYWLTL